MPKITVSGGGNRVASISSPTPKQVKISGGSSSSSYDDSGIITQLGNLSNQIVVTFNQANVSYTQANAAYEQANTVNNALLSLDAQYDAFVNGYYSSLSVINNTLSSHSAAITVNYGVSTFAANNSNSAYNQANAATTLAANANANAAAAFGQANIAWTYANTVNTSLNSTNDTLGVLNTFVNVTYSLGQQSFDRANSAYDLANTKLSLTGGEINGNLFVSGNSTIFINQEDLSATYKDMISVTRNGQKALTIRNLWWPSSNNILYTDMFPGTGNYFRISGNSTGATGVGRIDLNASQVFITGSFFPQGAITTTRTGDASSTASQRNSYSLGFQTSLWNGGSVEYRQSSIRHIASTAVNLESRLSFWTHQGANSSTEVERFCVTSNGNMGIGISNPTEKLQVEGNILANGTISASETTISGNVSVGQSIVLSRNTGMEDHMPAANTINVYGRQIAGRMLVKQKGPSGLDTPIQPMLAFNTVAMCYPASGTTIGSMGTAMSNQTTIGTPTPASTNLRTQTNRWTMTTTTTANAVSGTRFGINSCWRGNAAGLGGFFFVSRFGFDTWLAGARFFTGLRLSAAASGTVEISTLLNFIGVGQDAADSTIQIMHNDGSGAATKIDTTWTIDNTTLYELVLFAEPNGSEIYYRLKNLGTDDVFEGVATTDLPTSTSFLVPAMFINNAANAALVRMDGVKMYLETDY